MSSSPFLVFFGFPLPHTGVFDALYAFLYALLPCYGDARATGAPPVRVDGCRGTFLTLHYILHNVNRVL